MRINFKIATPERVVFKDEVDSITLPTVMGEITILPNHIPLISVFERLVADGIRPGVTLSISPTLGAMLENELLGRGVPPPTPRLATYF